MGDSMSSVVISGDTSGAITLSAPAVAGTNTVNLPAAAGTVMVSGNMPAFSYYATADQSLTSGSTTKVTYSTSLYDTTSGMYSSSRFTPTVAGYYNVYAFFEWQGFVTDTGRAIFIYKNGSSYRRGQQFSGTGGNTQCAVNGIIYLNGSTDYIEIYAVQNTGTTISIFNSNGQIYNTFEACLMRTA
jgi:hypothetical protein